MGSLAEISRHLRHDLRGGARICAVELVDISAKGESHERCYERPAFHSHKHASGVSKFGKFGCVHFRVHCLGGRLGARSEPAFSNENNRMRTAQTCRRRAEMCANCVNLRDEIICIKDVLMTYRRSHVWPSRGTWKPPAARPTLKRAAEDPSASGHQVKASFRSASASREPGTQTLARGRIPGPPLRGVPE
jgi:hypothetical protein